MKHAVDLDTGHCYARERAEQDSAQRISQGGTVSTLKRLNDESVMIGVIVYMFALYVGLFYFFIHVTIPSCFSDADDNRRIAMPPAYAVSGAYSAAV
jgi:hypothetical protein